MRGAIVKRIRGLSQADGIHLRAAEGWLDLGDMVSASDELEEISAEARAHPLVLFVRYEIYARAGKWDMAAEVSNALTKILPDEPTTWAFFAYATRRKMGGSIAQAKLILLEAEPKFPSEYQFPFNLACYCAQLHQLDEAEKWLEKAVEIDTETVRKLAIDDPDLKPLWDSMKGTLRKQE